MVWPISRQGEHPWDVFSPHRGNHTNCWNSVLCACGFMEYFCCFTKANRHKLQWWGTTTGCWLKANNPPMYHTVQSSKTPGHPQVNKAFCVPAPPRPLMAVPPVFLQLAGLWHRLLLLICQIQREGKGGFAGGVLWILTRESDVSVCWKALAFGSWCVNHQCPLWVGRSCVLK